MFFIHSRFEKHSVLVSPVSSGEDCRLLNNKVNQTQEIKKYVNRALKSTSKSVLRLFHQNIKGMRNKTNELISSMHPNFPHILFHTEHHTKQRELQHIYRENYTLGANYHRKILEKEGVFLYTET